MKVLACCAQCARVKETDRVKEKERGRELRERRDVVVISVNGTAIKNLRHLSCALPVCWCVLLCAGVFEEKEESAGRASVCVRPCNEMLKSLSVCAVAALPLLCLQKPLTTSTLKSHRDSSVVSVSRKQQNDRDMIS